MAVYDSGNGHQLPMDGQSVGNATPCTSKENVRRQQLADSPQQQQAQQQHWTDPQQQQDLQQHPQPRQRRDDSQPNTWQTAIGELCLHPGASQLLIERQEVGPLAYSVSLSDSNSVPNRAQRGATAPLYCPSASKK